MATAKQLAALAKGRAALKRKRAGKKSIKRKTKRKTVARKKIRRSRKKIGVNAKSRATRKAPTKRLKARRKKNRVKGMYPNPSPGVFIFAKKGAKKYYLQRVGSSWTFDDHKPLKGFVGSGLSTAISAAKRLAKRLPPGVNLYSSTSTRKKKRR